MNNKIEKVEQGEVDFQWLPNSRMEDPKNPGSYAETGTILKINNYIMFLKSLSKRDLEVFKYTTNSAIDHELSTR